MKENIENLLNISMEVTENQRQQNRQLSAGFDSEDDTWEIIVKYAGDEQELEEFFGHPFVFLYNQYAISRGTKEEIERLAEYPRVEWVEKPKTLEYALTDGVRASCVTQISPPRGELTGRGVLIAVIDSGIDIFHPDFQNADGTTRIMGIWDQTEENRNLNADSESDNTQWEEDLSKRYLGGTFYTEERINRALAAARENGLAEGRRIVPMQDLSGHGTHVAGIAAGNGRASNGQKRGMAPEASLLIVKLGNPTDSDFPRTTQVMTGIDFAVRFALRRNLPLVINLSFGNNYGPHDGSTLLETYINGIFGLGKVTIVTGMGNQGIGRKHTSGRVALQGHMENVLIERQGPGQPEREKRNMSVRMQEGNNSVSLIVGPGETGFGLQIWKNYVDIFDVIIRNPSGRVLGPFSYGSGLSDATAGNTEILFFYGEPVPYRVNQEIYITFLPSNDFVDVGEWQITFLPNRITEGHYEMWLPDAGLNSAATNFLQPMPDLTITIPATAKKIISVGAYDAITDQAAGFSGRGGTALPGKPDLVAPGVNVESCAPGGGYTIKSGTSMAAPFVAGAAALLMQYGIVMGKDEYLYGEKVKAYLRKGARVLPGMLEMLSASVGYGALCVEASLPGNEENKI